MRRTAILVLLLAALGQAIILYALLVRPAWRLTYNPSPSAARGFHLLAPFAPETTDGASSRRRDRRDLAIGDQLLVWPPSGAARLAEARGYVPRSVPLLKSVSALFRARVCRFGAAVTIDGRLAAIARGVDRVGRPLPVWQGCRRLDRDEIFLLGRSGDSFDGRYFGRLLRRALIARATPLWTW